MKIPAKTPYSGGVMISSSVANAGRKPDEKESDSRTRDVHSDGRCFCGDGSDDCGDNNDDDSEVDAIDDDDVVAGVATTISTSLPRPSASSLDFAAAAAAATKAAFVGVSMNRLAASSVVLILLGGRCASAPPMLRISFPTPQSIGLHVTKYNAR